MEVIALIFCLILYFLPTYFGVKSAHPKAHSIFVLNFSGLISGIFFGYISIILLCFAALIWSRSSGHADDAASIESTNDETALSSQINSQITFGPILLGDIKAKGVYISPEVLTDGETLTDRILPLKLEINAIDGAMPSDSISSIDLEDLKTVCMDDATYDYRGIFVKPDVIFETGNGLHIVVEIKTREISAQCKAFELGQTVQVDPYFNKDVLQLMISAWVYGKSNDIPTTQIQPVVRYKDYLILLNWDLKLEEKIGFYGELYIAWLARKTDKEQTVSATDLSKLICVMDQKYFASKEDSDCLSSLRGELMHLIAIHGRDITKIKNALKTARANTKL